MQRQANNIVSIMLRRQAKVIWKPFRLHGLVDWRLLGKQAVGLLTPVAVAAVTSFLCGWLLRSRTELPISGVARRVLVAHIPVVNDNSAYRAYLLRPEYRSTFLLSFPPSLDGPRLDTELSSWQALYLLTLAWSTGAPFEKFIERWLRHWGSCDPGGIQSLLSLHVPAAFGCRPRRSRRRRVHHQQRTQTTTARSRELIS